MAEGAGIRSRGRLAVAVGVSVCQAKFIIAQISAGLRLRKASFGDGLATNADDEVLAFESLLHGLHELIAIFGRGSAGGNAFSYNPGIA